MKTCPTCKRKTDVLINNVQGGTQFCHGCAPPSFLPHFVLTVDDVLFLIACGVNPELSPAMMDMVRAELN